jgi:hypothetical protein
LKVTDEKQDPDSDPFVTGSDPQQNVIDPQHWFEAVLFFESSSLKVHLFADFLKFLMPDPTFLLMQIFGSGSLFGFLLQN